ncbi:CDP-alcohol phosphatidyltransferase family protein [Luteithermobacter gelatinilyticus]|uniref:CDP-alcohol phosphatidyltransferase family protein n=1 Tax=Luteithermobacter gelatinilyticus TaxID=2582913 RepID=UPI001106BF4E|nr:CDP-alcohol phosphatidyltransferase family protein [Luteithermobacter gelatinilyticus]
MSETVKRTSEIEEFTNLYLIHPISSWLVPRLASLRVSPNAVSLSGMFSGVLAGVAYSQYQNTAFALAGFAFMLIWHIMDGADGQLARLTQTQSEFGKVIDGICDYVVFISVYVGLALALSAELGLWVWIVVLGAGASHAIQSGAYEVQRQEYDYWGHGKASARLPDPHDLKKPTNGGVQGLSFWLNCGYVKMQYAFSGVTCEQRRHIHEIFLKHPDRHAEMRRLYRETFARSVKVWSVMCANYRTFAIFIACIFKEPLWYFWFEIAVLNLVLFALVQKQKRYNTLYTSRLRDALAE